MSVEVLLGLGSNSSYGGLDSVSLLSGAVSALGKVLSGMRVSSVYESRAMYVEEQENFLNLAVSGRVDESVSPFFLLDEIHRIEAKFGRDRSREIRFGPRSLDIDIEEYGNIQMNGETLVLPHPRMAERAFVLIPALEIFSKHADEEKKEKILRALEKLPSQDVFMADDGVQRRFRSLSGL